MITRRVISTCCVLAVILATIIGGCHGSDEVQSATRQPTLADTLQMQITQLREENSALQRRVAQLVDEHRTATSRVSELQIQLTQMQEKMATPSPPAAVPPSSPAITEPGEAYQAALKLFRTGSYAQASSTFQELVDGGIRENLKDNCFYWLGECSYAQKKYQDAIGHFATVLEFPISEKKDDSQMMIANSYLAMGNKAKAKEAYERLIQKFPASPFAGRAREKLAGL